jgi:hypothetical protein
MVKGCVFFAVQTEFLNIIQMSLGLKGLTLQSYFRGILFLLQMQMQRMMHVKTKLYVLFCVLTLRLKAIFKPQDYHVATVFMSVLCTSALIFLEAWA